MDQGIKLDTINESRPKFDKNLEGLRGFAALSVAYAHVFGFTNLLDPSYHPSVPLNFLAPAHASVLIFFILSGYLIGLTNPQNTFSIQNAKQYLIRRAIRLVPIYWCAIFLSLLFSFKNSWIDVFGNLFFLQTLIFQPIQNNTILWSLNYEVLYYLLFLLVWWINPNLLILIVGSLVISILGWTIPIFPQILHSYASGWIFWLTGLFIAWNVQSTSKVVSQITLVSYICLLIATDSLGIGKLILNGLGFKNQYIPIVNLSDLFLLPICLQIITTITNRDFKKWKYLKICCLAIPLIGVIFLSLIRRIFDNQFWIVAAVFTILAILFWSFRTNVKVLSNLSGMGKISYAFYILHMPVMNLIHDYFPYQGTIYSFIIRLLVWLLITIGLSVLLEIFMQPVIKQFLAKKLLA